MLTKASCEQAEITNELLLQRTQLKSLPLRKHLTVNDWVIVICCCLQGRPYCKGEEHDDLAEAIYEFNEAIRKDDRVEVVATPFRDGVSIIMRK